MNNLETTIKMLYISPAKGTSANGMLMRELQMLRMLEGQGFDVTVLCLATRPSVMNKLLSSQNLNARSFRSSFSGFLMLCYFIWHSVNHVLCNVLKIQTSFRFFITLGLPARISDTFPQIFCYYPWAHKFLRLEQYKNKVTLDLGDIMADRHKRIGRREWISLSSADEKAVIHNSRSVICISQQDGSIVSESYRNNISVIPFWPSYISGKKHRRSAPMDVCKIGFIGPATSENTRIANSIIASIRSNVRCWERAELIFAGSVSIKVREIINNDTSMSKASLENIETLGFVEDLGEFYNRIDVLLNPVGPSTGLKIKNVEALASGVKLVTTCWGADETLQKYFSDSITVLEWPLDITDAVLQCVNISRVIVSKDDIQKAQLKYRENILQNFREIFPS